MPATARIDGALSRLARRLLLAELAGELCRGAGRLLLAGGAAALLLRALLHLEPAAAAWAFAPLVLVPAIAWRRARARVPGRAALATWLDRESGGSGALVTAFEIRVRDAVWGERLEHPLKGGLAGAEERLRLRGRPLAAALLPGALFAALALLVPLPDPAPARGPDALAQRVALDLRQKLDALAESVRLEERVADELEQRLERAAHPAGGERAGESFLEAADALRERLASLAREAAESARRAQERLAAAGAAAEGAGPADEGADGGEASLREAFEQTLGELAEAGLEGHLAGDLSGLFAGLDALGRLPAELPAGLVLDARTLRRLEGELAAALSRGLSALALEGLLDPATLRRIEDLAPLSELLAELHTCDEACQSGGT